MAENLVDAVLFMHYQVPGWFEAALSDYAERYDERAVSVVSPTAFDVDGAALTESDWRAILELHDEHNERDWGIFDHELASQEPYAAVLAEIAQGGETVGVIENLQVVEAALRDEADQFEAEAEARAAALRAHADAIAAQYPVLREFDDQADALADIIEED